MPTKYPFIPHEPLRFTENEMIQRARDFFHLMDRRRSVRDFSDRPLPSGLVDDLIRTASTAPSGAHKQPWTFCLVTDPAVKRKIREAAEQEEHESYHGRMPPEWLADLLPLGTDWHKPFLEIAPCLIIVFKRVYEVNEDGSTAASDQAIGAVKHKNYYVEESVGIACGLLLAAVHQAGLVALTHTPSPMNFLSRVLGRPDNERPYLLIPIGFPAEGCRVPDLRRKALSEVMVQYA